MIVQVEGLTFPYEPPVAGVRPQAHLAACSCVGDAGRVLSGKNDSLEVRAHTSHTRF